MPVKFSMKLYWPFDLLCFLSNCSVYFDTQKSSVTFLMCIFCVQYMYLCFPRKHISVNITAAVIVRAKQQMPVAIQPRM